MKTSQKIVLVVAALGLLAAAGFKNQAGPRISGLFFSGPIFTGTGCRMRESSKIPAQENRLYAICARTLILAETLAACASHDIACTENDGRALQANAATTLQELMELKKTGDARSLAFTREEGEALRAWLQEVSDRFAHIEMPGGACNSAKTLVSFALQLMHTVIA